MDFTLEQDLDELRARVRAFIDTDILPLEADRANYDAHENIALPVLDQKRALAKQQGLWAPQAPKDRGGLGLPVTGWAAFYEEANRSIFGPVVLTVLPLMTAISTCSPKSAQMPRKTGSCSR